MSVFDMMDPMARELDQMRAAGYAAENGHPCEGCSRRVGIPCLHARNCTRKRCPKCGKVFDRLLALSRRDNKTMICEDCGMQEAMEDYENHQAR